PATARSREALASGGSRLRIGGSLARRRRRARRGRRSRDAGRGRAGVPSVGARVSTGLRPRRRQRHAAPSRGSRRGPPGGGARAGRGSVTANAEAELDAGPSVDATAAVRDIDIAAFSPGERSSKLGLDLQASLRLVPASAGNWPISGVVTMQSLHGTVDGYDV